MNSNMSNAPKVDNIADVSHDWSIPPLRLYASHYGKYPSRIQFDWVLNFEEVLEYLKKKRNIESYVEGRSETQHSEGVVITKAFVSVGCGVSYYFQMANSRSIIFEPEEDRIESSKRGRDGYSYAVMVLYDPSEVPTETVMKNYVDPIKDLGKANKSEKKLQIVSKGSHGFYLSGHEIKEPEIDFDLNYNKGFKEVNENIKDKLSTRKDGIILLHGPPGTGKTMYIRHLINNNEKDNVIYLPPDLISAVSSPDFATFLLDYPDSLLIVEDAESAIENSEGKRNQSVSNLLNMADGLLSDALQMQILATFNSDINKIDSALLRKGRLIEKYEFKELAEERAIKLAKKIGSNVEIDGPAKLSTIYNPEGVDQEQKQEHELTPNQMGFGSE